MEEQIKALEQQVADLTLESDELNQVVASQKETIEQLHKALLSLPGEVKPEVAKPRKPTIPAPVEIDGKEYRFKLVSFVFDGLPYTAEEASTDIELCRQILKATGESVLRELV